MRGVTFAAALALLTLAACVTETSSNAGRRAAEAQAADPWNPVPHTLEQLQGQRLAAALRGKAVVPRRRSSIETPYSEHFKADGILVLGTGRGALYGTYEIRQDSYCLTTSYTRCYTLHVNDAGTFYARQISPRTSSFFLVDLIN